MELNVNHRELNAVAKEAGNNATLLDEEIDKLVDSTNELKEICNNKVNGKCNMNS